MTTFGKDYDDALKTMVDEARKRPLAENAFIFIILKDGSSLILKHLNSHDTIDFELNHDVEDMETIPRRIDK